MKKDNLTIIISLISLIISISVATLNFFQYFQNQKEMIAIDVKRIHDGQIKLTEYSDINNLGHVLQIPWRVVISNIGIKKTSVIECKIENIHLNKNSYEGKSLYYGVNGGLFNINGENVKYPITLDGGESRIFTAYVGILTNNEVYVILRKISAVDEISINTAKKVLGNANTDIFGNNAELYELENGYSYLAVDPKKRKLYSYVFEFTTGKKKHFGTIISEYIN